MAKKSKATTSTSAAFPPPAEPAPPSAVEKPSPSEAAIPAVMALLPPGKAVNEARIKRVLGQVGVECVRKLAASGKINEIDLPNNLGRAYSAK